MWKCMSNEAGKPLGAEVPSLIIIIIRTAAASSSSRFSIYVLWEEEEEGLALYWMTPSSFRSLLAFLLYTSPGDEKCPLPYICSCLLKRERVEIILANKRTMRHLLWKRRWRTIKLYTSRHTPPKLDCQFRYKYITTAQQHQNFYEFLWKR